jgi:tRNA A-37 threonylcarbamoyl transferase component Bud32
MADVFLARRRGAAGVEKRLVVKRIRPEHASNPRFVELFINEARLSVDLAHANIVPVFDFGRDGDELFLAMEHVDGRDLAAALRRASERGAPLDPVLVAHIGAECCQGLDYAHRRAGRGLVHRDVTPRNVLLSFAGEVKLTDFGVASLDEDRELGRLRGTPAYMSPEQARGEPVDGRSDLFSLGLVLAEAATGERAYRGADTAVLLAAARAGLVPPLPERLPTELRAALERATRPARDDRFPDARAMQRALDAVVIAARAADPTRPAPSHELAAWLAALFPDRNADDSGEPAVVGAHGVATMRSIAETLGEEPARPRRARLWAAGALVVAGGLGALWLTSSRSTPEAVPPVAPPPPAPIVALAPDAPVPVTAAPPPAVPSPPRPAPARRAPPRLYPVDINARPWARVSIDGRYVDDTPFRAELPAGRHRLRFDNPEQGSTRTVDIDVPRDQPVVVTLSAP